MIQKAWYAVLRSGALGADPVKVVVNNRDMVLFRDDFGHPHAFSAYCPHRGCDLSRAALRDGELVCPFHGWRFNHAGQCTHIPANRPGMLIPGSAQLSAYPVCDQMGLVWTFGCPAMRDETVPELPLFHECKVETWRRLVFETDWDASFCRVVESVLDLSHLPFVHPETTGQEVSPVVDGPDYEVTDTRIMIHPTPFAPFHPMEALPAFPDMDERTEIELIFPNQWMIRTPIDHDSRMCTFLTFTPVARSTTRIFGMVMRNFELDSEFLDVLHLEHTHFVMNQDREIVECLRPIEAPDLKRESHVPSDGPAVRFRSMLFQALLAEGRQA